MNDSKLFLVWLIFFTVPIGVIDFKTQSIRKEVVISLHILFYLYIIMYIGVLNQNYSQMLSFGIGYALINSILCRISYLFLKGIGKRDMQIILFILFILGVKEAINIVFISFLLCALIGGIGIFIGKWNRKKELPYIPFLSAALVVELIIRLSSNF